MRAWRTHVGLAWPGLGVLGSLTAAAAATRLLAQRPVHWWWQLPLLDGHGPQWHVFWLGIVVLCAAWLGLGRRISRSPDVRPRDVALVGALWAIPLALGPALFSLDMYSYLAQGAVLAHGANPYRTAPQALVQWHQAGLLSGVSQTWRHTTAPYGPGFLALAALAAKLAGSHVTLGVTLLRIPELVGFGLLAAFVPRLARALGADPVRATWLAVISPLTLLYLIGGGHNDALMAGLMVAGVTLAVERRPLPALALCTLAATVKLPAAAAIGMVIICWLRAEPRHWPRLLAAGAGVVAAVTAAVGLLAGVGFSWISASLFSTPETARMALTPATALSVSLWEVTHHFGAGVEQAAATWEHAATLISFAVVGLLAAFLCLRVRYATLPRYLGFVLIAAALGGPAAWPWYLSWGVALLAADRRSQRSLWLPVGVLACVFPVMAGGQVAITLPHAFEMLLIYCLAGAVAAAIALRRRRALGLEAIRLAGARLPHPLVGAPTVSNAQRRDPHTIATSEATG